jgi:Ca2+-binding EF-hand superfamily protein
MKLARCTWIGAMALALAAGSAYAADKPKSGFDALDKNDDGVITKEEAKASPQLAKNFDAIDKNHDGKLTRTEYAASTVKKHVKSTKAKNPDPGFNALDKNDDGMLSRLEARGNPYLAKHFKEADKNGDGKLSRSEYLAVMAKKDFGGNK